MSAASPESLSYVSPLGPGQIRVTHGLDRSVTVLVGPQPWIEQVLSQGLLVALLGVFSVGLAVLVYTVLTGQGILPMHPALLLLPMFLVWSVLGMEFGLSFRNRSTPTRLVVAGGKFAFPYPLPRSRTEELPVLRVVRLDVEVYRTRLLRRERSALVVGLGGGATMRLLAGYPRETLDRLCDVLGPELGLTAAKV